jgi:membrane protein
LIAATVLIIGLVVSHLWLPDGRRKLYDVIPGIGVTLVAWMAGALMFASYLKEFATYVSTYAGLASIMIALVFLYIIAAIFILGAEINAAILKARARAEMKPEEARLAGISQTCERKDAGRTCALLPQGGNRGGAVTL